MSLRWILGAVATGVLLSVAALAAERTMAWLGLPRRWVWMAAIAGTLALPLAPLVVPRALPRFEHPTRRRPPDVGPDDPRLLVAEPLKQVAPGTWEYRAPDLVPPPERVPILLAWLAASLAVVTVLGMAQRRLRRTLGPCEARVVAGSPVLVSEYAGPMVLGLARPRIVLPRWAVDGPGDELRMVVRHEREHLAARDTWLLAAAGVAVAAMPWSLALWWQHRRLRLAVETDCDARVLARGEDPRAYGRMLLRAAASEAFLCAPAAGWGGRVSDVARRIDAIAPPRRRQVGARAVLLAACSAVLATAALAASSRAVPEPLHLRTIIEDGREKLVLDAPYWHGVGIAEFKDTGTFEYRVRQGSVDEIRAVAEGRASRYREYPTVTWVKPGSSVQKAGLRAGDVILAENGADARIARDPRRMEPMPRAGSPQTLLVRRGNRVREIRFAMGPPPSVRWMRLSQADAECWSAADALPMGSRVRCPDMEHEGEWTIWYRAHGGPDGVQQVREGNRGKAER